MTTLFDRNGVEHTPNYTHKGKPALLRNRPCSRCGGQGGADKWKWTGWTCHRCGGGRIDPTPEIVKLYTAEKNAALDAAAAKREAKRRETAEKKARLEAERRERERQELLTIYARWIEKIEAELAFGEIDILRSVLNRITVEVKAPTERQVEVVEEIISRNQAERKRRETAEFVGEIGERREFTLVKLLWTSTRLTSDFPKIYSHWSVFLDDDGNRIVSSSAPWLLGLEGDGKGVYVLTGPVRVKATVVKQYRDKNDEPCTRINRPKRV